MKIRIVKKCSIEEEYYFIQKQNIFKFWTTINHSSVVYVFYGEKTPKRFITLESAKEGLENYKKYLKKLKSLEKDKVVYTETI